MKTIFRISLILLLIALLALPTLTSEAASATRTLTPYQYTTQSGADGGEPVANLGTQDQSGADDDPAKYVTFLTPSSSYKGTQSFQLPGTISPARVSALQLQVNFKGADASAQKWSWYIFNWGTRRYVLLGDNTSATADTWSLLTFNLAAFSGFVNPTTREIRVQTRSNNSTGDAKVDYEALILTYKIPSTPTPTAPPIAWPNISPVHFKGGFSSPVHIANANDGSDRIFVVEQCGTIKIIQGGATLSTPFLDISSVVLCGGEQGLLSVAFPPNYAAAAHFYVYYTNLSGNNVVARYSLTGDPNVADSASGQIVLTIPHPDYNNHNGGQLAFGPDGFLYIGPGDGGSGGDPNDNAQNPNQLLGKILRIDVETGNPTTYTVPAGNPFVSTPGYLPEIWAVGMRNPWRFSFDRQTGDLYIADVGQDAYEEVDFQSAASAGGENYGWRILEGRHCYNPSSGCVPPANYAAPVTEYAHGAGDSTGCSITGGFVYRGTDYVSMQGFYFFSDYCTGRLWALINAGGSWKKKELLDTNYNVTTFGEDEAGNIYFADAGGAIYKLTTP
jgi:glucose/arabinose dehydrogenase